MHEVSFPVSTPAMVVWAISLVVLVILFVRLLNLQLRKNRRWAMLLIFLVLLLAGTLIHMQILARSSHTVTDGNWVQVALVSLVAGLEMFIGHTVVFDDIIAAVVFHEPGLLLTYLTILALILSFSFVLVFQMLPRRLRDRIWLRRHHRQALADRKNHVFLGISPEAKLLAKSILRDWESAKDTSDQGSVIFVDLPAEESVHAEVSLGEVFTNLVSRRKELNLDEELGSDRFVLLKGEIPLPNSQEALAGAISLPGLEDWFANARTNVYLLGRNEQENMDLLDRLVQGSGLRAKVFCRASRSDGYNSVYSMARGRVRIIDTHYLTVQEIKFGKYELHPIHFVDLARDADGNPLGYVTEGFHALLAGLRGTGQEMLHFLYEFGSFVGKDRKRVDTSFHLFDDEMDQVQGDYLNRNPGMRSEEALIWHADGIGTDAFWQTYEANLPILDYVVVATGDQQRNTGLAIQMLETAAHKGKDLSRFVILTQIRTLDARLKSMLDFFNGTYAPGLKPVIQPFGVSEDIWTLPTISGKGLKEKASRFYAALQRAIGGEDNWERRKQRLSAGQEDRMRNTMALMRQQREDLSRRAYVPTLRELAGPGLREAAQHINAVYNGAHYSGSGPEATHLEYLAATETLRWASSHLSTGYVPGEKDELLKRFVDLVPYDALTDPLFRHFHWVAVKTALTEDFDD